MRVLLLSRLLNGSVNASAGQLARVRGESKSLISSLLVLANRFYQRFFLVYEAVSVLDRPLLEDRLRERFVLFAGEEE
jgi:hypothetical protein